MLAKPQSVVREQKVAGLLRLVVRGLEEDLGARPCATAFSIHFLKKATTGQVITINGLDYSSTRPLPQAQLRKCFISQSTTKPLFVPLQPINLPSRLSSSIGLGILARNYDIVERKRRQATKGSIRSCVICHDRGRSSQGQHVHLIALFKSPSLVPSKLRLCY